MRCKLQSDIKTKLFHPYFPCEFNSFSFLGRNSNILQNHHQNVNVIFFGIMDANFT